MTVQEIQDFVKSSREICERAPTSPWREHDNGYAIELWDNVGNQIGRIVADSCGTVPFIISSRTALPQALEIIDDLAARLSGDPSKTATPEQREAWRLSAIRYSDKLEKELAELRNSGPYAAKEILAGRGSTEGK